MTVVAARSFVGVRKSVNQDAYCAMCARTSLGDAALVTVCDGVGGLSSGEIASSACVKELSTWFEEEFPGIVLACWPDAAGLFAAVEEGWSWLIESLNSRLCRYAKQAGVRMGTTLTAFLVVGNEYCSAHVGDCRAYLVGDRSAVRITGDQTLAARAVEDGEISAEEADAHPGSSVILQAVGAQEDVAPVFGRGELGEGDVLLVCCDGFYRRTGDAAIAEVLGSVPHEEDALLGAIDELVARAVEAGEQDNITAVCLAGCAKASPAAAARAVGWDAEEGGAAPGLDPWDLVGDELTEWEPDEQGNAWEPEVDEPTEDLLRSA